MLCRWGSMGLLHRGVCGETWAGLLYMSRASCQTLTVVRMRVVMEGFALRPRNGKLLSAA